MIDHLLGRPSTAHRRWQVLLVLLFWSWRLRRGSRDGPRLLSSLGITRQAGKLSAWQTVVATLSAIYTIRNWESLLGLQAPEPLARLYSPAFYRATYIVTALDVGHATALTIRPVWLRHFLSLVFSGYYLIFANEADEKLRKYRAVPTVEFLRGSWEKTSNPIIRFATRSARPRVGVTRAIEIPRPADSVYTRPVRALLYFAGTEAELRHCGELILDLPGGGFICMSPEHHEERLLRWTIRTRRPILSLDYGKAPEFPFPYALHEAFDVYRLLAQPDAAARLLGMRPGSAPAIVLSGDSAGANLAAGVVMKLLELPEPSRPPLPIHLIWAYPALDFNLAAWMSPEHLAVLHRNESAVGVQAMSAQKDHLGHRGPLSVVPDDDPSQSPTHRRRQSWTRSFAQLARLSRTTPAAGDDEAQDDPLTRDSYFRPGAADKPLKDRVLTWASPSPASTPGYGLRDSVGPAESYTTRLTMTSRAAFVQDRILTPSTMRAMAILYVGPRATPDMAKNYYISPILAPDELLAHFPPLSMICASKDPLVDDTIVFGGRLREAKLRRQMEARMAGSLHGEGLRMSASAPAARDPIVDQTEADWVSTSIVEGWSHGFLQMITLLPEVETYIHAMADWINDAFAKDTAARAVVPQRARTVGPGTAMRRPSTPPRSRAAKSSRGDESDGSTEPEDSVLSFTPRRRNFNAPASASPPPPFLTPERRSASLDESFTLVRPAFVALQSTERRGSDSNVVAPAFMTDSDLLRQRREEAVIGL